MLAAHYYSYYKVYVLGSSGLVMVQFVVKGPFPVPLRKGVSGGRLICQEKLGQILEANDDVSKPGCYVFSCASGRGSLPVYVGKASKNIFKEAFNDRNINGLNEYLSNRRKAKIEFYAIHQSNVRGQTGNEACIEDIEDWLIGFASRRTTQLLNIHGARPTKWSIAGVANHDGKGHPGSSVLSFKAMMGMTTKRPRGVPRISLEDDADITPEAVISVSPDTEEAAQIEEEVSSEGGEAQADSEASEPNEITPAS